MEIKVSDIFEEARELNENGKFFPAISRLIYLLIEYMKVGKTKHIHIILNSIAINYYDLEDFENSLLYSGLSLAYKPTYEFASLHKYLALSKLDRDEEAMQEMLSFLDSNDADLYKTTIEELLEGLENGFMTKYETQIKELADKYGISIVPGASTK